MKGTNVHKPVFNFSETLVARSLPLDGSVPHIGEMRRSAHVHSPAQVLPKANSMTIRERWRRWSCVTAEGLVTD